MNDKDFKQKGGEGSTNQQALAITNHNYNYGPTEEALIASQTKVLLDNMPRLAAAAADLLVGRGQEFIERFIVEKLRYHPKMVQAFSEPGMQIAFFNAQREYATSGDNHFGSVLLEFLSRRAQQPERSTEQLFIDESLNTIAKLSIQQLDAMSIILMGEGFEPLSLDSTASLETNLTVFNTYLDTTETRLSAFASGSIISPLVFEQLKRYGCVEIRESGKPAFFMVPFREYSGLLCKGLDITQHRPPGGPTRVTIKAGYSNLLGDGWPFPFDLTIPCLHNDKLLQFNALNARAEMAKVEKSWSGYMVKYDYQSSGHTVNEQATEGITQMYSKALQTMFMTVLEAESWMSMNRPVLKSFFDMNNAKLNLTSLGRELAQVNIEHRSK